MCVNIFRCAGGKSGPAAFAALAVPELSVAGPRPAAYGHRAGYLSCHQLPADCPACLAKTVSLLDWTC